LAKIPKHDVGICNKSTPEIMRTAHDSIYEKDKRKEEVAATKDKLVVGGVARSSRTTSRSGTQGGERDSMDSPYKRTSPFFVPRPRDGAQPSIRSLLKERRSKKKTRLWVLMFPVAMGGIHLRDNLSYR
jgi:hypothetical protein